MTLAYDGSSHLTSVKDPDGALWTYAYDSTNHLTTLKNPLSSLGGMIPGFPK